jgi:hypothetical protein
MILRFKPGQKVLVLEDYRDSLASRMQHFIGKVVTISSRTGNDAIWPYRIVEDERWVWMEKFFASAGEATDPNIIFQMRKGGKNYE